jgi:hypothetical protein
MEAADMPPVLQSGTARAAAGMDRIRSAVEALIRCRKQSFGIVIEVGASVDDLRGDPQPPAIVTQKPGVKRGAGEELVAGGLAQRETQAGLDPHLTGRQVLPLQHVVDVVLLVHESGPACKKVT